MTVSFVFKPLIVFSGLYFSIHSFHFVIVVVVAQSYVSDMLSSWIFESEKLF